jgi:putative tryptophan/tyrosine transport system substrate-binding protein
MRWREFITVLGAAAAWPLAARAQQPAMPAIGFLDPRSPDGMTERLRGFRQGLKDTGYVEGGNLAIEFRWTEGRNERLPGMTAEPVRWQASVIVALRSTPGRWRQGRRGISSD